VGAFLGVYGGQVISAKELIADLEWRGLIAQTTNREELIERLDKGMLSFYCGYDPTAPSLHVGNLVVLLVMKRLQMAGHKPFPLVGGATGLIGDPSGRNEERSLNSTDIVANWVTRLATQLGKFLEFNSGDNKAVMVNNLDWTQGISALEFLRDVGKHFSVNTMLSKDSVSARIDNGGISYTEFSYQVLQAFDFMQLYKNHNVEMQLGGSDQWGNIVAGLDLIRKVEGGSGFVLTVPLLVKSDGSKFGKTASGAVWLDPQMTSAYAFYQYWLNSDDADMENLLKVFSFKSHDEITSILAQHSENPGLRFAQKELAHELTSLVHSEKESFEVQEASKALFGQSDISLLSASVLDSALSQLPSITIKRNDLVDGKLPTWIDLISEVGIVKSKSDARRLIREGGAHCNNVRVVDENFAPTVDDLLHDRFLLLRKGKKDLAAVIVEN
jgi:tyrosyl-tRNA synthetase